MCHMIHVSRLISVYVVKKTVHKTRGVDIGLRYDDCFPELNLVYLISCIVIRLQRGCVCVYVLINLQYCVM